MADERDNPGFCAIFRPIKRSRSPNSSRLTGRSAGNRFPNQNDGPIYIGNLKSHLQSIVLVTTLFDVV